MVDNLWQTWFDSQIRCKSRSLKVTHRRSCNLILRR